MSLAKLITIQILLLITLFSAIWAEANLANQNISFPEFSFPVSPDQKITNEDLQSKYYLVNFFFTSCPHICPTINGKIYTLQQEFADNSQLAFLSLSVDPERDTFQALGDYAKRFQVDKTRWFLTRPAKKDLNLLIDNLKLAVGDKIEDHSTRLVLVKPDGNIYAFYHALNQDDFNQLKQDLKQLLSE